MTDYPDRKRNAYLTHSAMRAINKAGKKAREWKKALVKLEKEAVANGIFQWKEFDIGGKHYRKRMGTCLDCKKYKHLTPDHVIKRSQGGGHASVNIEWPCRKCHDLRDNRGDPMNRKPKNAKKIAWKTRHPCKVCKKLVIGLLCPHCGNISL